MILSAEMDIDDNQREELEALGRSIRRWVKLRKPSVHRSSSIRKYKIIKDEDVDMLKRRQLCGRECKVCNV